MEMLFQKKKKEKRHTCRGIPWWPVVKVRAFTAESLVRELSSHKPHRVTKKQNPHIHPHNGD